METILVPTDFSAPANNATDYAVELAKFFDTRLVLINAYTIPPAGYEAGFSVEILNALQKGAMQQLESLKKQLLLKNPDLTIELDTEMGVPYDVIKIATDKYKADLIVMGIVGNAGKIKEHIIGSTAVHVARKLEVPAFIIPENVKYHRIHHISFACDMQKIEKTMLVYMAKYFSQMFDADLEIVNVEKPKEETSYDKSNTSVFIEKKLETVQHKTVYITENNTGKALEEYFKNHPTDIIMLNPKKHNIFHNLFNESITKELAFHAGHPILTIH